MAIEVPVKLHDLLEKLEIEGVPNHASAGQQITARLTPYLGPVNGDVNPLLKALATRDTLAVIDLTQLVNAFTALNIGLDVELLLKAVEWKTNEIEASAAQLRVEEAPFRALPHLIPEAVNLGGEGLPPQIKSQHAEGLIGRARAKGKLVDPSTAPTLEAPKDQILKARSVLAEVLSKPVLERVPDVRIQWHVEAQNETRLNHGEHFLQAGPDWFPVFVFLPEFVEMTTLGVEPPVSLRRIVCEIVVGLRRADGRREDLPPRRLSADVFVPKVLLPTVAAMSDGAGFDAVLGPTHIAVPASSPFNSVHELAPRLELVQEALSGVNNLSNAAALAGRAMPIPVPMFSNALAVIKLLLDMLRTNPTFMKADEDWCWRVYWPNGTRWLQDTWSSALLVCASPRFIHYYNKDKLLDRQPRGGFFLYPSGLGVAHIPDLTTLESLIGNVAEWGQRPTYLDGTYNDNVTHYEFSYPAVVAVKPP